MSLSTSDVSSTSGAATTAAARTDKTSLGKDDFLKLLTAQLANQDPTAPVDNQAFIAQLAQFSSLEQLQGLTTRLDSLLVATASSSQMSTANLVGKDVTFQAAEVALESGTAPDLQVSLPASGTVTAVIQDASGRVVRTMAPSAHDAGVSALGWDGRDDEGNPLPSGSYAVKLSAKAVDGTDLDASARASGRVTGVAFDSGVAQLLVGGAHVKMSDVVQITQP